MLRKILYKDQNDGVCLCVWVERDGETEKTGREHNLYSSKGFFKILNFSNIVKWENVQEMMKIIVPTATSNISHKSNSVPLNYLYLCVYVHYNLRIDCPNHPTCSSYWCTVQALQPFLHSLPGAELRVVKNYHWIIIKVV